MTKNEYLNALIDALETLPAEELHGIREYYEELIDDRIEEKGDEAAAIAELDDPHLLAEQIMRENGSQPASKGSSDAFEKKASQPGADAYAKEDLGSDRSEVTIRRPIESISVKLKEINLSLRQEALPAGMTARIVPHDMKLDILDINIQGGALSIEQKAKSQALFGFFGFASDKKLEIILDQDITDQVALRVSSGELTVKGLKSAGADFSTVSGGIRLSDIVSTDVFNIKSSSGDVHADRVDAASLSIATDSGDLSASRVRSTDRVKLHSASGDIDAGRLIVAGDMTVECASGDVDLSDVECGEALNVRNVSGDIDLDGISCRAAEWFAVSGEVSASDIDIAGPLTSSTVSGDISIDSARARGLNMKSISGDITVELKNAAEHTFKAASRVGEVNVPGTYGPLTAEIKSTTGDIDISQG